MNGFGAVAAFVTATTAGSAPGIENDAARDERTRATTERTAEMLSVNVVYIGTSFLVVSVGAARGTRRRSGSR